MELSDSTVSLFEGDESEESVIKIESKDIEKLVKKLVNLCDKTKYDLKELTIVAPYELRQIMSVVIAKFISNVTIVSREELTSDYPINVVGKI